jgi:thiamine biosynthesis lipoprotein
MIAWRFSHSTHFMAAHSLAARFLAALLLASLVTVTSCSRQEREFHYSLFTFGTLVDITLYDTDQATADAAFGKLQADFDRYHQQWSPWTQGDLATLNSALQASRRTELAGSLRQLVHNSVQLSALTDGYYNPAIGKLINLWQFHRYEEQGIAPPDAEAIAKLVSSSPSMDDIHIVDGTIRSDNPDVLLNFGAYAKGFAIALGLQTIRTFGIDNAIINAGGDLGTIGKRGDRPWNIGIRHPREDSILASVQLKENESVFTSGDYERVYFHDGKRYHHILDPRTGYPTEKAQSVTVIHEDPGGADASSTALFVAGSTYGQRSAEKADARLVMLVDEHGEIHLTPGMQKRLNMMD